MINLGDGKTHMNYDLCKSSTGETTFIAQIFLLISLIVKVEVKVQYGEIEDREYRDHPSKPQANT